jgi:hypothetical protein
VRKIGLPEMWQFQELDGFFDGFAFIGVIELLAGHGQGGDGVAAAELDGGVHRCFADVFIRDWLAPKG